MEKEEQSENEESRQDNTVDMSWLNKWRCSPSWNKDTTDRVQQEFAKFKQALVDIENEGPKKQKLTATTDFKIVFAQLNRVSMTAIKLMASHAAEVDQLLHYALIVLMHARGNPKLFDQNTPPLLRRIGNYLKSRLAVNPWDISRHWPDGPTTTNGTCSACKGDLNCRWLTDPATQPLGKWASSKGLAPKMDREPWCQPCYEERLFAKDKLNEN